MNTTAIGYGQKRVDVASIRDGEQCSSELEPAEARAMLAELSGTPLRPGEAWSEEAQASLAEFQRSEGLPPTGELDDVTVGRLTLRFRQASGAGRSDGPARVDAHVDGAARERVLHMIESVVHAAEQLAHQLGAHGRIGASYVREATEWATQLERSFAQGALSEGEVARATSSFRNAMSTSARATDSAASSAITQLLRKEGTTLAGLLERYAGEAFDKPFTELAIAEQGAVYLRLAQRAGLQSKLLGAALDVAPKVGKTLFVVGIAVAIVQVATAEDKLGAGVKAAAGFAGGAAGMQIGAALGTVGGPLGIALGTLVGGLVGAMAAEAAAERTLHAIRG